MNAKDEVKQCEIPLHGHPAKAAPSCTKPTKAREGPIQLDDEHEDEEDHESEPDEITLCP